MRDFFQPGRSPALGLTAAVAASHALASATALRVLSEGGNAADAAVTATFVMCVVEPQSTGLGGDCFALVHPAGQDQPIGFNGSGRTPAALDPARAQAEGGAPLDETSIHAVTTPGLVDGLERLLARFGTWPLARCLEPAIGYAEDGFPVHQRTADEWSLVAAKLARTPEGCAMLLRDGRPPAPGAVWRFPALAMTLRRIAEGGAAAFYGGRVAQAMADFLAAKGGFHAAADFAAHAGQEVTPISILLNGQEVWQIPPNGQGATALMMMALMARNPQEDDFDGADRHCRLARASAAAFATRDRLIADPEFGAVPLEPFLKPEVDATLPRPAETAAARGDTAYVAVVDSNRTAVSLISSLFEGFGTGFCDPETGVVFHNRGSGFSAKPDHPNALAPAKRPLHTIMPGMVSRQGRPVLCFGVTGGPYQPIGQTQIVSGVFDHGQDIQDAIDRPRSFLLHGELQLEPKLMRDAAALQAAGLRTAPAKQAVGGAHGIHIDWACGTLTGGSDARKDGCALAF